MIDHIEIYVSNLNNTKKFYNKLFNILGYETYQEWNSGISYRYLNTYIVFVQTEPKYLSHKYHRKHTGLNHLAFSVDSTEKVDFIRNIFLDTNTNELYENKYPNAGYPSYALFFEDPDRIKIEIVFREN